MSKTLCRFTGHAFDWAPGSLLGEEARLQVNRSVPHGFAAVGLRMGLCDRCQLFRIDIQLRETTDDSNETTHDVPLHGAVPEHP